MKEKTKRARRLNETWQNGKIDKGGRGFAKKEEYLAKGDRKMLVKRMER